MQVRGRQDGSADVVRCDEHEVGLRRSRELADLGDATEVADVRLHDVGCVFVLARRSIFARIPIQSRGPFAHTEILAKANFLGCYFGDVAVAYRPGEAAPAGGGWWADARRVIAQPDFGPAQLPEPAPVMTPPTPAV